MYYENHPIVWMSGKLDENDTLTMIAHVAGSNLSKQHITAALAATINFAAEQKGMTFDEMMKEVEADFKSGRVVTKED